MAVQKATCTSAARSRASAMPLRHTRARSKIQGAPQLMKGLGTTSKPPSVEELPEDPERITSHEVLRRISKRRRVILHIKSSSQTSVGSESSSASTTCKSETGRPEKRTETATPMSGLPLKRTRSEEEGEADEAPSYYKKRRLSGGEPPLDCSKREPDGVVIKDESDEKLGNRTSLTISSDGESPLAAIAEENGVIIKQEESEASIKEVLGSMPSYESVVGELVVDETLINEQMQGNWSPLVSPLSESSDDQPPFSNQPGIFGSDEHPRRHPDWYEQWHEHGPDCDMVHEGAPGAARKRLHGAWLEGWDRYFETEKKFAVAISDIDLHRRETGHDLRQGFMGMMMEEPGWRQLNAYPVPPQGGRLRTHAARGVGRERRERLERRERHSSPTEGA